MPRDQGLANVIDYRDLEVIAVNMPNSPACANVDWNTYLTTVDAIETLTGYDLLALLPDDVEAAVESNTQPPFADIVRHDVLNEGGSATFIGRRLARSQRFPGHAMHWISVTGTSDRGVRRAHLCPGRRLHRDAHGHRQRRAHRHRDLER